MATVKYSLDGLFKESLFNHLPFLSVLLKKAVTMVDFILKRAKYYFKLALCDCFPSAWNVFS